MKSGKEIKQIAQSVLDVTLWGHYPGEIQDIIKSLDDEDQGSIYNELFRQRLRLEKQMKKIEDALYQTKRVMLADIYDSKNKEEKGFGEVAIEARYTLLREFMRNAMIYVDKEHFDPETEKEIRISIPYYIPYYGKHVIDSAAIANIKKALEDLWFVEGDVQPIYEESKKIEVHYEDEYNALVSYIATCVLDLDNDDAENVEPDVVNGLAMLQRVILMYIFILEHLQEPNTTMIRFFQIINTLIAAKDPDWYVNGDEKEYELTFIIAEQRFEVDEIMAIHNYLSSNNLFDIINFYMRQNEIDEFKDMPIHEKPTFTVKITVSCKDLYDFLDKNLITVDWRKEYGFRP